MEKIKFVIPEEGLKGFSQLRSLKLNLNGKKHKKGRNTYKAQLNQIRRFLR